MRPLTLLLMLLLAAPSTLALVDLANPADDSATANGSIVFDYYASVPDLTSCTVNVAPYSFPDPDVQNSALNSVTVQNIPDGQYLWNVTCQGDAAESSATRSFTIDGVIPTLAVISPSNGTVQDISIDIIPADDRSPTLACDVRWNADTLDTLTIASNERVAKAYQVESGNGTLRIACADQAGNTVIAERALTVQQPLFLTLSTDKQSYGPLEQVRLAIDAPQGANVTVDICPNQTGFVQCATAILGSSGYPQTITLPYMNRTGTYLVEGLARLGNQTRSNTTDYAIENTLTVSVERNATPRPGTPINLTASAAGGIGPYRYSWSLHNGTALDAQGVTITYPAADEYTERVTAYDSANNSRELAVVIEVRAMSDVTVRVYDNATGQPITGADVSLGEEQETTLDDGVAFFSVTTGTYDLLASAAGYRFSTSRHAINGSRQIGIGLARDTDAPTVRITADATASPAIISASVTHAFPVTCILYIGAGGGWFAANGTATPDASGTATFTRDLPSGQHEAKVECADERGRSGASDPVAFTVSAEAPDDTDAQRLQQELALITAAVDALDKYGPDEREAIGLTGFDRDLRNARRALQQAIRDIDALQYRDIDAASKKSERSRIVQEALDLLARTPRGLRITDKERWVRYATEEQIAAAAELLADEEGVTPEALERSLAQDQQAITISTTLLGAEYTYADGTTGPVTVITRAFTFAPGIGDGHRIVEIIPKEVARTASEIAALGEVEVLEDDPILAFPKSETITYMLQKRIDRTRAETITTLLVRPAGTEPVGLLAGFAILPGIVPASSLGIILAVAVLAVIYIAWRYDLIKQITYLTYRIGRNEKAHYLRVLMHDVEDQLSIGDYAKAEMLYREIRLMYGTLSVPASNDIYDDLVALVRKMDSYYCRAVMVELDACLKTNDHEGAIAAYEKILGTYERLDDGQQQELAHAIAALGQRLGLEAPA